jgi:hypothetical protein
MRLRLRLSAEASTRTLWRLTLLAAVSVTVAAGVAVADPDGLPLVPREEPGQPREEPGQPSDREDEPTGQSAVLPPELLELPVAEEFAEPLEARRAARHGDDAYFVVEATRSRTCLLRTSGSGPDFESAGTCSRSSDAVSNVLLFREYLPGGVQRTVGLASGAFERIEARTRAADVTGGVFVLETAEAVDTAVLTGPNGSRTVDLRIGG